MLHNYIYHARNDWNMLVAKLMSGCKYIDDYTNISVRINVNLAKNKFFRSLPKFITYVDIVGQA